MAKTGASGAAEPVEPDRAGAQTESVSEQPREQKKRKTGWSGRQVRAHAP